MVAARNVSSIRKKFGRCNSPNKVPARIAPPSSPPVPSSTRRDELDQQGTAGAVPRPIDPEFVQVGQAATKPSASFAFSSANIPSRPSAAEVTTALAFQAAPFPIQAQGRRIRVKSKGRHRRQQGLQSGGRHPRQERRHSSAAGPASNNRGHGEISSSPAPDVVTPDEHENQGSRERQQGQRRHEARLPATRTCAHVLKPTG